VQQETNFRRIVGGAVIEMTRYLRSECLKEILLCLGYGCSEPDADIRRYQVQEAETYDGVTSVKCNLNVNIKQVESCRGSSVTHDFLRVTG
jgi:hypothetical protein